MIDLSQVSLALRNSTSRSLILLDEFGKGTTSTDGAGIFCGVIKYLLRRGDSCPKVLAATHFHDVFKPDMLDPQTLPFTPLHMQVMFTTHFEQDIQDLPLVPKPSDKITYLYRVAPGFSLASHAAQCAEIFGVPLRVVERARYVSELISEHELRLLLDEDMTEEERQELADAEAVFKRFLEWDIEAEDQDVMGRLAEVLGLERQE